LFAVGACYAYATQIYQSIYVLTIPKNATIEPYMFVVLCLLIFIYPLRYYEYRPLSNDKYKEELIPKPIFNFFILLSYIQLFITLYSIYKLKDISYVDIYTAGHEGESIEVLTGPMHTLDRYTLGFYSVGFPFLLFQLINNLLRDIGKRSKNIYLLCIVVLPSLLSGVAGASRGGIVFAVVNLFFFYILFQNQFPKRIKKILLISVISATVIMSSVIYAITYSRLGENSDAVEYGIGQYAGESYINVVIDYWDKVKYHPMGERLFDPNRNSTSIFFDKWTAKTGVSMPKFKTMPIDIYIDFGKIGAIIFIVAFSYIFSLFARSVKIRCWTIGFYYWYFTLITTSPFSWQFAGSTNYNRFLLLFILSLYLRNVSKEKTIKSN
jgi:oligosaccharide repeat unit polymerase